MVSGDNPCVGWASTTGEVRIWSEDALTARVRSVWTAGDQSPISASYARGAAKFVERLAIRPGDSVLDVACGAGSVAIPAATAGARVTGIDIAPYAVAQARLAARVAGSDARFDIGDAEALDFPDHQFDTTVTMFGAMFASRPERVAAELVRVTRSGGRIAMANWTPAGLMGEIWRAHTTLVPQAAGIPDPFEWGREDVVRERFGGCVTSLECTRRVLTLRFALPPEAVTEVFATSYGPTVVTLRGAGPEGASRLRGEFTRLLHRRNIAGVGTAVVGEFLEVLARVP